MSEEVTVPAPVERGIKETKEVFEALDVLAEFLAKMLADGRVDGSDMLHLVGVLKDVEVFADAIKGIKEVDDELKNLDQAELLELGAHAYKTVKKVVEAVKAAKK